MAITNAIEDIAPITKAAIEAADSFTLTFSRMAEDLQVMGDSMNNILEYIREEEPFIRALAKTGLEEACSKWTDIKTLAMGFITFRHLQV